MRSSKRLMERQHNVWCCAQGPADMFWPEITLKTQRVVDAVQKSWQQDGAKIMVKPWVESKL